MGAPEGPPGTLRVGCARLMASWGGEGGATSAAFYGVAYCWWCFFSAARCDLYVNAGAEMAEEGDASA